MARQSVRKKIIKPVRKKLPRLVKVEEEIAPVEKTTGHTWFGGSVLLWSIVLATLVMNIYLYFLPKNVDQNLKVTEKQISQPTITEGAVYYKYEVPRQDWFSFDAETEANKLLSAGILFDEVIFQSGGPVCLQCKSYAAPLLYVKNPSKKPDNPWVKVNKPGFYSDSKYKFYDYVLQ